MSGPIVHPLSHAVYIQIALYAKFSVRHPGNGCHTRRERVLQYRISVSTGTICGSRVAGPGQMIMVMLNCPALRVRGPLLMVLKFPGIGKPGVTWMFAVWAS